MRRTTVGLLCLGAAALVAASGCSGAPGPGASTAPPTSAPPAAVGTPVTGGASSSMPVPTLTINAVTEALARTIALGTVGGGRVTEIETGNEDNIAVWKVTVETADGKRHLVSIDTASGAILANETAAPD